MPVYFAVDDQSPELKYLCPVTKETVSGAYFNKTWTSIASAQCRDGWFQYTFYGVGVEVVAFSSTQQNHSVKIDDGPWVTQSSRGGFLSSTLTDGRHTISYASGMLLNPTLDYVVVEAGTSSSLQDRTIIVDDTDPSLRYSGSWSTKVPSSTANDLSTASFRDTTHWSTTAGDVFEYQFSGKSIFCFSNPFVFNHIYYLGSSIALFGSFANVTVGHNFSATYSVDGVPTVASTPNGTLDGIPLTCLFSSDLMPAGNHTFSVNITQISPPLSVGFDFLTYNASFASLDQMPGHLSQSLSLNDKKRTGAIAGGVLGGVALLFLIVFSIVFLRRRSRKLTKQNVPAWSGVSKLLPRSYQS